ncbi:tyrosine-type recombinase/integrase [Thalassotalea sp. PLHSN55]|uniref:tyrosine-type recombinase/integrase n=1 Tax=Thalassotalea sp. PLHSN55 TaxID=3435888 RepID=UPI003F8750E6
MKDNHFRFTEKAIAKLTAPKKRTRFYDVQMPGLVLDITLSGQKAFRVYKKLSGKTTPLSITLGNFPSLSIEQARKLARKTMADIAEGINPNDSKRQFRAAGVTLNEVYETYKLSRDLKDTTLRGYEQVMRCYFKGWLNKRLADLTEDAIYKLHTDLTRSSPAQADFAMRTLRALFNFAKSEYKSSDRYTLFPHNPVTILSDKRAWNNVARKQTRLRPTQFKPFFEAIEQIRIEAMTYRENFTVTVCDFVEFMAFTGLRKTELLELEWGAVYLKDNLFWLERTKNGSGLELPLTPKLIEILDRRAQYKISKFVFGAENKKGRVIEPKKIIQRINSAAELAFTLHDLRRTYCSIAESIGVGAYTMKRLLNHKTARNDVTAGYTVLTAEELREPAIRISNKIEEYAGLRKIPLIPNIESINNLIVNMSKQDKIELIAQLVS